MFEKLLKMEDEISTDYPMEQLNDDSINHENQSADSEISTNENFNRFLKGDREDVSNN